MGPEDGKQGNTLRPLEPEGATKIELNVIGEYHEQSPQHEVKVPVVEDGEDPVPQKKKKRIRLRHGLKVPVYGELTWTQLWLGFKELMKDPLNVAVLIWMVLSSGFLAFVFLSEIGVLNSAFNDEDKREYWTDIAAQVMNALFVLMNLVFHPLFFHHTLYLWRWRPRDQLKLRMYYCKGGFKKPNDWFHMVMVVIQLHIMCFSMYALALVYWIYDYHHRPALAKWTTFVIACVSPCTALMYAVMSPLQKDYQEVASASSTEGGVVFHERKLVFALDGKVVEHPQWQGALISGCCSKKRTAFLTCLLPCVVFGMHMHRLGFGNKFIQGSTFLLFIAGPMLLFEFAAQTVKDSSTKSLVVGMGLVVAQLSLVYGAIWRTRMRKRYHLSSNRCVCGNATMTDYAMWLLCPFCSLCQEVRTSQHYQVVEETSDGLFVDPDELAEGGADMEDSELRKSSNDFSFEEGYKNPMEAPEVMQNPGRGSMNKNGFVRLEKD